MQDKHGVAPANRRAKRPGSGGGSGRSAEAVRLIAEWQIERREVTIDCHPQWGVDCDDSREYKHAGKTAGTAAIAETIIFRNWFGFIGRSRHRIRNHARMMRGRMMAGSINEAR